VASRVVDIIGSDRQHCHLPIFDYTNTKGGLRGGRGGFIDCLEERGEVRGGPAIHLCDEGMAGDTKPVTRQKRETDMITTITTRWREGVI